MARNRSLQSTIWLHMLQVCLVNFVCISSRLVAPVLSIFHLFPFLRPSKQMRKKKNAKKKIIKCEKNSRMNNVWLLVLFVITLVSGSSSGSSSSSSSSSSSLIKQPRPNIENIIWKCNFAFLQSFLGYFKSCGLIILEVMIWLGWIGDGRKIIITFWGQGLLSSTQL